MVLSKPLIFANTLSELENRNNGICSVLCHALHGYRKIFQEESPRQYSRCGLKGKPSRKYQQQHPDAKVERNAEATKENPETTGIGFLSIAARACCCKVMYIVDVSIGDKDAVSTMLVCKVDRYDMVYLHRLAQHNTPAVRTHIEFSECAGMCFDELIPIIVRALITRISHCASRGHALRQHSKNGRAEPCESEILPADGPGISSRPRRCRCSAFPTHFPMRQIQVHAFFPT